MIPEKTKNTAVFNGRYFEHFRIHPTTVTVFGRKVEDIVSVEITVAENQDLPPDNDNCDLKPDYWAWWDNETQDFSLIYAKRVLLQICMPYGIEAAENTGQGKAYRVNVNLVAEKENEDE